MSIRCALSFATLTVVAGLTCAACDDGNTTVIGATPTPVNSVFLNRAVSVTPASVQAAVFPLATCPDPLFLAPFNIVITADGSDLFLTGVQMQFLDHTGIRSPTRSITRAGLLDRFDSTRIAASTSRTFPLEFTLGCTGAPPGTLTVIVVTSDSLQREHQATSVIAVN